MKSDRPPAATARASAGFTLEQAAKRARITSAYLRQVEKRGASYSLAKRLAALYGCPIDTFLGGGTLKPRKAGVRNSPSNSCATSRAPRAARSSRTSPLTRPAETR